MCVSLTNTFVSRDSVRRTFRYGSAFWIHLTGNRFSYLRSGSLLAALISGLAGSLGYAAVLGRHWHFGHWPDSWKSLNITILELFPLFWQLRFGAPLCAIIALFLVRRLLTLLVLNYLKHNILFKSKHIPGILNRECDLLSRLQVDKFKLLAPHADVQPTPVPSSGIGSYLKTLNALCYITGVTQNVWEQAWNHLFDFSTRYCGTAFPQLKLVLALSHTITPAYHILLFQTMFLVAFYGFFRVGELAIKTPERRHSVLQFQFGLPVFSKITEWSTGRQTCHLGL